MGEVITKLLVGGAFLGIVIFIGLLFLTLLFLLLCKIENYYEEKGFIIATMAKKKVKKNDGGKQQ